VARRGEERALVRGLDDAAEVHHGDPVRRVLHHREVVRDQQVGEAEADLQVAEQVHHLRLDGDVERADRLVAHQQLRPHRQRAGDADALALAAGELVRVALGVEGLQPDQAEQFLRVRAALRRRADAVDGHRLGDGVAHRQTRVEAGVGVLEHDLHAAAELAQGGAARFRHVLPVEADAPGAGLDQAHDEARGGGLAAAGLAHQRQGFAAAEREAHPVHGAHRADPAGPEQAFPHRVVLGEVCDFEQRRGHGVAHAAIASSTGARWQAAAWPSGPPGPMGRSAGSSATQTGAAKGQRGWKRQPVGRAKGGGTLPSMERRRSRSSDRRGMLPSRPMV
jgi:hypothetical protein